MPMQPTIQLLGKPGAYTGAIMIKEKPLPLGPPDIETLATRLEVDVGDLSHEVLDDVIVNSYGERLGARRLTVTVMRAEVVDAKPAKRAYKKRNEFKPTLDTAKDVKVAKARPVPEKPQTMAPPAVTMGEVKVTRKK